MIREKRLTVVNVCLALFALALVIKAAIVQLWEHDKWVAAATRQHFDQGALPAPRGTILDATGVPLAQSRELVEVAIAPREVTDTRKLSRALREAGVTGTLARRAVDRRRSWVPLNRKFMPSDVPDLLQVRGVHATPAGERVYIASTGVRRIVGRVDQEGKAVDGIELVLDSLLRGEGGRAAVLRDSKGRRFESPEAMSEPPRPGHTVRLTINYALQDIAERALAAAAARMRISGGDIVMLDPRSGEILAMVSRRSGPRATANTALTEPFEPGSTLKPFFAGYLIENAKARADEVIETYNGSYTVAGRTITDVHKDSAMSLADVIRYSSNVGIARFTERLTRRELYTLLRDIGFGMPTGVPYPSEASGILREPRFWSAQSHASLAIGYELAVTPLQLAAAYAAIANGGELLAPTLIKDIRDPDSTEIYRAERQVVRRVFKEKTAKSLREMLEMVVDSGTATNAAFSTFGFAGKSGTARRTQGGRYGRGSYTATFVGLFPAERPQYVILVKLDNPQGAYYGGQIAAPIAKEVIEAAIAARDGSVDRSQLAAQKARYVPPAPTDAPLGDAEENVVIAAELEDAGDDATPPPVPAIPLVDTATESVERPPVVIELARPRTERKSEGSETVPDVRGLPLRVAVRELHRAGFRVQLVSGTSGTTVPPAGASAQAGALVRLARP
jgi:cell division protein FtsI (penicillin-binding protein 3)